MQKKLQNIQISWMIMVDVRMSNRFLSSSPQELQFVFKAYGQVKSRLLRVQLPGQLRVVWNFLDLSELLLLFPFIGKV